MRPDTDTRYVKEVHDIYGKCTREQMLLSLARCYQRIDDLQDERNKLLANRRRQDANQ